MGLVTRPGETHRVSGSATNAAVVLTIPGEGNVRRHLSRVVFSYSGTPTGGALTIAVNGSNVASWDITSGGPGPLALNIRGDVGAPMTLTLAAGGSGVVGKLYAEYV